MTLPELKKVLNTLGLPLAYLKWAPGQVPELPYILYYADEDIGFYADDRSIHRREKAGFGRTGKETIK